MFRPGPDRWRLRLAGVGALSVGLVLLGATSSIAQSLGGGCRAVVSGRAVPSMTFEDPLVVTKGKRLRVNASVPASSPDATTNLDVKVGPISNSYSFKGTRYNRNLSPPSWLFTLADGVIRFSGTAAGEGFDCAGDGYVKIDGDGLVSIIGGALLGAGGVAGVAGSSRPKTPPTPQEPPAKAEKHFGHDLVNIIKEMTRELGKDVALTFAILIVFIIFISLFAQGLVG